MPQRIFYREGAKDAEEKSKKKKDSEPQINAD